jgi:hypothetical protein
MFDEVFRVQFWVLEKPEDYSVGVSLRLTRLRPDKIGPQGEGSPSPGHPTECKFVSLF